MYFRVGPVGCLLWSIFLVWVFFALKLYYFIFAVLILVVGYIVFLKLKNRYNMHIEEKERKFEPEMGEVYKVCPYCNNDIKRSATVCPHCKNSLE